MTKFLTFIVAILGAASVHAAESAAGSEFMHQTPVGKFELTPGIAYQMYDYNLTYTSPTSAEVTGFKEVLISEYGLADEFSAGLTLAMSSLKTSYSPSGAVNSYKKSGLEDPVVFFHGKYGMGGGLLRYGIDVNFALGKSKKDSSGDYNNASGGIGAMPFVGWETTSGPCTMGAKLSYKTWFGDRKYESATSTPAQESNISGGETTTLSGFWEHQANAQLMVGASLGVAGVAKTESKLSASPNTVTKTAGMTLATVQAYGSYKATESATILPTIGYIKGLAQDNAIYDSISGWLLGVGARFAF